MTQLRLHSASPLPLLCFTSLLALLGACNGDAMSVGSNDDEVFEPKACGDGIVQGPIHANHQKDIDALYGCELIRGDLRISVDEGEREDFSLAALASLRQVGGSLDISGVASLDGLEALEQVGALALSNVTAPDLRALRSLKRVIYEPADAGYGGGIDINDCPALRDLQGLEQLTSWAVLSIGECPALERLDGLAGPAVSKGIYLNSLPALRDLYALDFAREVEFVLITGTGIESLQGFSLRQTEQLSLVGNPALTSLGSRRLASATAIAIDDNDSLVDVELPGLEQANVIKITDNDALTSVARYNVNMFQSYEVGPALKDVNAKPYIFEVGNNAALTSVASPDGFYDVQQIAIWGNPALVDLDLGLLESADGLTISDNPRLSGLNASQLLRVDELEIVNNPALSTAALSGVQSFEKTMSGNLDAPAP